MSHAALPAGAGRIPSLWRPGRRLAASLVAAAVLLAAASGLAVALSHGKPATPAELAQDRAHLALVAKELARLRRPVARAISTSQTAWPIVSSGLPSGSDLDSAVAFAYVSSTVASALSAARAIPTPQFVPIASELTGPARRIAILFEQFLILTKRGWSHTNTAIRSIRHGPAPAASFALANAPLYVNSIYQGALDLSQIGERVLSSYERLGGPLQFGSALTATQVALVAHTYAEPTQLSAPTEPPAESPTEAPAESPTEAPAESPTEAPAEPPY